MTFRNFHGAHRFNIVKATTDGSAFKAAACYGTGMFSVRTFNAAGEDVVETGSILASCPTDEYKVIVNQADGGPARGASEGKKQPSRKIRQAPPLLTATVLAGTRTVAFAVTGPDYDQFVYRFIGGGVTGTWFPLEDSVVVSPVHGNAVTVEVRGCVEVDGDCLYDGPIVSAEATLADPSLR